VNYEDLDAVELRAELDDWTARTIKWADDLANAIDGHDLIEAAFMVHGYRQARMQVKKIRHAMQVSVA